MSNVFVILTEEKILFWKSYHCWGAFSTLEDAVRTSRDEQLLPVRIEEWELDGSPGSIYECGDDGIPRKIER